MNWKTTIAGLVAAIGTTLTGSAILPEKWAWIGTAMQVIGLGLLGAYAADKSKQPPK